MVSSYHHMTNPDELTIIEKVLAGDQNAFGTLVDRYQHMAYTIAVRILGDSEEASDIVQESFVKSYEVLETFRGDAKFSSWLYRIVYRKSLDRVRVLKRKHTHSYEGAEGAIDAISEEADGYELLLARERKELVKAALSRLKPEDQTLITLFYFEESSIREISEIMGLGMDNVKIRLFRTRQRLFELLKGQIKNIAD